MNVFSSKIVARLKGIQLQDEERQAGSWLVMLDRWLDRKTHQQKRQTNSMRQENTWGSVKRLCLIAFTHDHHDKPCSPSLEGQSPLSLLISCHSAPFCLLIKDWSGIHIAAFPLPLPATPCTDSEKMWELLYLLQCDTNTRCSCCNFCCFVMRGRVCVGLFVERGTKRRAPCQHSFV